MGVCKRRRDNGAKRWFQLGPISFQVAEPVKVFVILALACLIQRRYVYMKPRHKIFEKRSAKVIQAADWIRPTIIKIILILWFYCGESGQFRR